MKKIVFIMAIVFIVIWGGLVTSCEEKKKSVNKRPVKETRFVLFEKYCTSFYEQCLLIFQDTKTGVFFLQGVDSDHVTIYDPKRYKNVGISDFEKDGN